MSTKSTIVYASGLHWHYELSAKYNYGIEVEKDRCMVIEMSSDTVIDHTAGDTVIEFVLKPDSELYKEIENAFCSIYSERHQKARQLLDEANKKIASHEEHIKLLRHERYIVAKLSSDKTRHKFLNPMNAAVALKIRDRVLEEGM